MNEPYLSYYRLLEEEAEILTQVFDLVRGLPERLGRDEILAHEFGNSLERLEVRMLHLGRQKKEAICRLSEALEVPPSGVSFALLASRGQPQFADLGMALLRLAGDLKRQVFRLSIFLKNQRRFRQEWIQLNRFLSGDSYSAQGERTSMPHRGLTREA
ncbi:MAG TPA: hypothetical protein PKK12_06890 [Candidatus Aminicenantes bacterium]|nr:hypothetical protein [Candidatus Aminicenantes bacterium]